MDRNANSFGQRLRGWRNRRGLSQLALAGEAGTTQRHLSFLESGRTAPSRAMVLRLGTALHLPLRQQNALLLAAGFAPAWRERDLAAPELTQVNRALDFMLAQQEPYPAFVVDRRWNLLRANAGAGRLTEFLLGPAPPPPPGAPAVNLAEALLAPDALRPFIVNWEETARFFLRGVQADAAADGTAETADLLARLLAFPGLPALTDALSPDEAAAPVLAMRDLAQPVHDHRHARHAARRDASGNPRRMLLSGGRGDGRAHACVDAARLAPAQFPGRN